MFQNYLKLATRNLYRNRRYVVINVLGLGIALGFCLISYLNWRFANTYDHWHSDADRIARVEMVKESNGRVYGSCPGALATAVAADLSGVEAVCRYDVTNATVKYGDLVFNENMHFADENFFGFFDFAPLKGQFDLGDRSRVWIDEDMALKYFGQADPIGQSLVFYADTDRPLPLTVGGVLKNIPKNSSIRFRFITHLDNAFDGVRKIDNNAWARSSGAVFLKLKSKNDFGAVQSGLQAYVAPRNTARPDWKVSAYRLESLRDLAHSSRDLGGNILWQGLPPAAVWGNIAVSVLLLLSAALNFSNMTISICHRRLREMGVRKVMGGTRFQLMVQMLTETLAIAVLAAATGALLTYPIADWYNGMWKFTDLQPDFTQRDLQMFLAAVVLGATLLAGSYPAFYVSAFRPAGIFRGGVLFGDKNIFSRFMLSAQIAISLTAVIVGFSFQRNAEFNRRSDIGFDYRPVLQAWLPHPGDFQKFEDAVGQIPGVRAVAGSVDLPGFSHLPFEFVLNGKNHDARLYRIGEGFPELMKMRLKEGVWPAPAGDTVASPEIAVTETFVRRVGAERSLIGEQILIQGRPCRISGIMADFMTSTPFNPIEPAVVRPVPMRDFRRCVVQTADVSRQASVMAAIEVQWKQLFPFIPFNVGYQDEMLREAIEVSDNVAKSMGVLSMVALLLSIAGLFSLVSLQTLRRMRELAIRRVLGASAVQVSWVLNKNFAWALLLSLFVGCLGGRMLAQSLMDSIFKVNYGVRAGSMLLGVLCVVLPAALTIAIKMWQTLQANPAKTLHSE